MNGNMRFYPLALPRIPAGRVLAWLLFMAMTSWAAMAILYSGPPYAARVLAACFFVVAAFLSFTVPRGELRKTAWFLSVFAPVLAWWLLLPPSNDRDWRPDVARLPSAAISGGTAFIRGIRDFDYRSENDYAVRYYDAALDLGSLRSMDLFLVDWGLPHIAHTMLSFGFEGDKYVCFSIETRNEKGERFSAVGSFFKRYELTYVVADERDAVRLRTNYRKGEKVYLYRLKAPPELIRLIFLDYLRSVNRLKERPEWYKALTGNCTTGIWRHFAPYYPKAKFDWRILASGHAGEMAYELGALDKTFSYQELKRRSLINYRSNAAGRDRNFSKLIRHGLPGFE